MLACLRSAQFMYRDLSASVVVELRRHHDTRAQAKNKEFLVSRRFTRMPSVLITKSFGTYREAAVYWDGEVVKLVDTGMERRDSKIVGFREEG